MDCIATRIDSFRRYALTDIDRKNNHSGWSGGSDENSNLSEFNKILQINGGKAWKFHRRYIK
jgi:hypothetical protein